MKRKLLLAAFVVAGALGMRAQTDVTSQYLTNADFNGTRTEQQGLNGNDRYIYKPDGWTVDYSNGGTWDMTAMNAEDKQWDGQFKNLQQPVNGGNKVYFIRFRYGGPTINLHQATNTTLPAGTYRVSADAFRTGGSGTATLSAGGQSVIIDTRTAWANYAVVFTLATATEVTVSFTFTGSGESAIAGIDNVKLEDITQGASDFSASWTTAIANAGFELGSGNHSANSITTPYGYTMSNTLSGWLDGYVVTDDKSEGSKAYNLWAGTVTKADIYQTVKLPVGKYTISADIKSDNLSGEHGVYAKIGEDIYKSAALTESGTWETLSKDFYVTAEGNVQLGVSSVAWFKVDHFQLTYKGAVQNTPYSIVTATTTAATTGKWYAVQIAGAGDYRIISSAANTVYYTQNGHYAPSDVSSSVTLEAGVKQVVALTKGTLYVRATNDATLTIEPDVYSYTIGDATISAGDGDYIQTNTITLNYSGASTNDPDGVFKILDGSKITVGGETASASLEGNVLTITLASPITTGASYAVSVAEGAVGYNAENANSATSLTIKTPEVFDGFYFLRNSSNKYISRGGDYNTRAIVDEFGLPLSVATNATGITQLTYVDNGGKLFLNGSGEAYTDNNTAPDWTLQSTEGGFYLIHANEGGYKDKKLQLDENNKLLVGDDGVAWTFEPASEHNTHMEALKDAQAATAATALGNSSITTKSDLATWLDENYNAVDVSVAAVSFTEKWNGNASAEWGAGKDMYTETVTELPEGLYKLTVNAYYRLNGSATAANGARSNVYLYGNNVKTQLYSIHDFPADEAWSGRCQNDAAGYYPDDATTGAEATTGDNYLTELYVYVSDGTLKYGIHQPSRFSNGQWFGFQNFTLTRYEQASATMSITDAQYATFCAPFAVAIPSGVTAYTVPNATGATLNLTTVEGGTIPANTPVVLFSESTVNETFYGKAVDYDDLVEGLLTGVYEETAAPVGSYVLQNNNGKVAFYLVKENKQPTVGANRAYLTDGSGSAKARAYFFDEKDASAIEAVSALTAGEVEAIYNAGGVQVKSLQKGMNIVVLKNGQTQKVFVK